MSKAFKCDICRKFYEENNEFHKYHIINSISETNLDVCNSGRRESESIVEKTNDTPK